MESTDLVDDIVSGFFGGDLNVSSSEANEIGEAGMSAYGYAVVFGQPDGLAHPLRVAGVEPARDVRGANVFDDLLIKAHLVHPETLTHVTVQVYPVCHNDRPSNGKGLAATSFWT